MAAQVGRALDQLLLGVEHAGPVNVQRQHLGVLELVARDHKAIVEMNAAVIHNGSKLWRKHL